MPVPSLIYYSTLKIDILSNPNGTSCRPVRGIIRSGAEHWMRFIARAGMQICSNSA
ncbi:MAG: hypothetical protein ACYC0Q_08525 [Eubacteriales bacterium]